MKIIEGTARPVSVDYGGHNVRTVGPAVPARIHADGPFLKLAEPIDLTGPFTGATAVMFADEKGTDLLWINLRQPEPRDDETLRLSGTLTEIVRP